LASRHHSLDLSELMDVTDLLRAFEEHNSCTVNLSFNIARHRKVPTLVVNANCYEGREESVGQRCLGYVSVTCSDLNLKTWNAVLTHVLYTLDFKLALNEFDALEKPKA